MSRKYFDKFPTTTYLGTKAIDLTRSAKLVNKFTNAPFSYYRMTVENDRRPEQISGSYYDDPYMSWMVYYSNKMVDPYYDWTLPQKQFDDLMAIKYGSVEKAQKKILEFRISWVSDESEMSPSEFHDRFGDYTDPHSKYWNPIYDVDTNRVLYYVRKANESVLNTNKVIRMEIANNDPSKFSSGDLVDLKTAPNGETLGTAEVLVVNTSSITIKNVLGEIANGFIIVADGDITTYANVANFSSSNTLSEAAWSIVNISDQEYVYWEPHTAYQIENENNTEKKSIRLVEASIAPKLADQLEKELDA